MLRQTEVLRPVAFDHAAAAAAIDVVARAHRICEDVRDARSSSTAMARVGWEGRARTVVEEELADLDAAMEDGMVALAELRDALAQLTAQAAELQADLARRAEAESSVRQQTSA